MAYLMIGLLGTLCGEECTHVRVQWSSELSPVGFTRDDNDLWVSDELQCEPLHPGDLAEMIQQQSQTGTTVECWVGGQQVVYSVERKGVLVSRQPAKEAPPQLQMDVRELGLVFEVFGTPKSRRHVKLRQAMDFGRLVQRALAGGQSQRCRILDLACGRSYLGFVLVHLLSKAGLSIELHGIDSDPDLVDKCRIVANDLHWKQCTFEPADLHSFRVQANQHDVVVSLHGCDTLSDEAIRIGYESGSRFLFVAPCCQQELRNSWTAQLLSWTRRYGLIEQRLADVLTDGYRCLVMEALGYKTRVFRFTSSAITPKNLVLQGERVSGPSREAADLAWQFLSQFGGRLRLAALLEAAGLGQTSL